MPRTPPPEGDGQRPDPAAWRLPWQETVWRRLVAQLTDGRLPHALLVTGLDGVGKRAFTRRLAMRLLCERPAEDACGECRGCVQFVASTHPDFRELTVAEGKSWIVIDQVRATLVDGLRLSAQYGARKVAMVHPADRMNRNSFNALLKTLEEPSGDSTLLLVSAHPARLAATVRSRCQRLTLPVPDRSAGLDWLRGQGVGEPEVLLDLCGGAPLAALELRGSEHFEQRPELLAGTLAVLDGRGDAAATAAGWSRLPMALAVSWVQSLLHDLLRLGQAGHTARLVNHDMARDLQSLAHRLDWQTLHRRLDELAQMRRTAEAPLNPQLQWEAVMYSWEVGG